MRDPENSTLGQYLTFLRQREGRRRHEAQALPATKKFSRERAAREAHITASYLTKVERDEVGQVSVEILRLLTTTYHASEGEWRYLCDLAGYGAPYSVLPGMDESLELPSLAQFQKAITPLMRTEMTEATTDLLSFFTPHVRLIAANRAYLEVFPGHEPGMSLLEWTLGDEGRAMLLDRDEQIDQSVAWHRGIMGRYGHTNWAQESHSRLWQFADFRRKWAEEPQRVSYDRPVISEARLTVRGGRFTMVMENWMMQNSLPMVRSRARLLPIP